MAGNAIVAATDAMLTTEPPLPAAPPGRMARKACFMPSTAPTTLTSHILRTSAGLRSTTSEVISTPALLMRMSKPPSSAMVVSTARSHCSSSVTSSLTKPPLTPDWRQRAGGLAAASFQNVADHDRRAGLGERFCDVGADAARASGHQGLRPDNCPLMAFLAESFLPGISLRFAEARPIF